MAHPLEAFKTARRAEVAALSAEQIAAAEAAVFAFWTKLQDHAGAEVMKHVTITKERVEGEFKIAVPNHLAVIGRVKDDGTLAFKVLRRLQWKVFDHFADALAFGEPFPLRSGKPAELPSGTIDTTPKPEAESNG